MAPVLLILVAKAQSDGRNTVTSCWATLTFVELPRAAEYTT